MQTISVSPSPQCCYSSTCSSSKHLTTLLPKADHQSSTGTQCSTQAWPIPADCCQPHQDRDCHCWLLVHRTARGGHDGIMNNMPSTWMPGSKTEVSATLLDEHPLFFCCDLRTCKRTPNKPCTGMPLRMPAKMLCTQSIHCCQATWPAVASHA